MKGKHYNIIPHCLLPHTKVANLNHFILCPNDKKLHFNLKDFSKMHKSIVFNNKISSNLTKNVFESSLFHTFEQQWCLEEF
jgi:hypothetical protein